MMSQAHADGHRHIWVETWTVIPSSSAVPEATRRGSHKPGAYPILVGTFGVGASDVRFLGQALQPWQPVRQGCPPQLFVAACQLRV